MKLRFLLAILSLFGFGAPTGYADPLQDLMGSPEMHRFDLSRTYDDLNGPHWLKPGSEFAALFMVNDGYLALNTWIAPVTGTYIARGERGIKYREYVESEKIYTSAKTSEIKVRILVPHPKFLNMVTLGLVNAFAALSPPTLHFENHEEVEVQKQKADIYTLKEGGCSLILKSVRGCMIEISQAECRSFQDLVGLADLLDLKRLERKLQS